MQRALQAVCCARSAVAFRAPLGGGESPQVAPDLISVRGVHRLQRERESGAEHDRRGAEQDKPAENHCPVGPRR